MTPNRHVLFRHLEIVGAFLEVAPEADVGVVAVFGDVLRRHAERVGLHLDGLLAAGEGLAGDGVDLVDLRVRHREAAGRRAGAVHEDRAARGAVGAVVGVGITDVERQVVLRGRIHLAGRDAIEAFRHLAVALAHLGSELAGPAAHREGLVVDVSTVRLHLPDLELGFLLVGADQHGRGLGDALLLHQREHVGVERVRGAHRSCHAEIARRRLLTAGETSRSDGRRGDERETGDEARRTHTNRLSPGRPRVRAPEHNDNASSLRHPQGLDLGRSR